MELLISWELMVKSSRPAIKEDSPVADRMMFCCRGRDEIYFCDEAVRL